MVCVVMTHDNYCYAYITEINVGHIDISNAAVTKSKTGGMCIM